MPFPTIRIAAALLLSASCAAAQAIQFSITDLSALGMDYASAVNDHGHVVGRSYFQPSIRHAALYDGSDLLDLGTLGGSYSAALGLNNQGQVVGHSGTADISFHAFVWDSTSGMTDLTTLGG